MAEDDDAPTLEIDWLKTAAGALAAVTTAVLLSTLGAVGTLIGAALGSVAATVGSALYAQGLQRSKLAVLRAQETTMLKIGVAQTEVRRAARPPDEGDDTAAEAHLEHADETLDEAKSELEPEPVPSRWSGLSWKRIAIFAAGTFVVVMLAITGFEKLAGESVSNLTGGSDDQGTTFGGVTGNSGSDDDGDGGRNGGGRDNPTVQPGETESPSEEPTEEPSTTPPETPTETPSTTPSESPSTTPTPTPSTTPTTTPSPTATTSPSATP